MSFERDDQRFRSFLAQGAPLLFWFAVDGALDRKQFVDTAHNFLRDRRLGKRRPFEKLAPPMRPARRLGDGSGFARAIVEIIEARKGIGLHHARPGCQMLPRIGAVPGRRVFEEERKRVSAAKRPVISLKKTIVTES